MNSDYLDIMNKMNDVIEKTDQGIQACKFEEDRTLEL